MSARVTAIAIGGVLVALLACAPHAVAQRLPLRVYSSADGLAGDQINAVLPDSRGFLWIGTSTGLSRFDGREFRRYSTAEGLPHPYVNTLLEDRDGALWIGTRGGLARIDPHAQAITRVSLGDGVAAPNVFHLLRTRDGHIWTTAGDALYVFADDQHRGPPRRIPLTLPTTPPPTGDTNWTIEALAEGRDGDLWIGTEWGLIRRLANGRLVPIRVRPTTADDRVYHVAVDRDGRVWLTHWGLAHRPGIHFGIYVFVPAPASTLATGPASGPEPAVVDPASGAVTTLHARARDVTHSTTLTPPTRVGDAIYITAGGLIGDGRPHQVVFAADGSIAMPTEEGLDRVDARGRVTRYDARNGLGMPLMRLAMDAHGDMWIGTRGLGLIRFDLDGIVSYAAHEGFTTGEVTAILEDGTGTPCLFGQDADGVSWFGTFESRDGIDRLVRFLPRGTERLTYWSWGTHQLFLRDHTGEWWVPSGEGLFRYPASASCRSMAATPPKAVYRRAQGLPKDEIFRLFEDSRGDLWMSSGTAAVRWVRASGALETVFDRTNAPASFAEDRAGNIWVGLFRGGLVRWRRTGSPKGEGPAGEGRAGDVQIFDTAAGVPAGYIHTVFVDSQGRLWIGGESGGLACIEDPTAASPRVSRPRRMLDEGLNDLVVYNVIEDRQQRLLVATARGLLRFDPTLTHVRRFTVADGLASHTVRTAYVDRQGRVWLGMHRGLSRLMPQPEPTPAAPPIFIDSLRIGGIPQRLSQLGEAMVGELRVDSDSRRLEIGYGSPSLAPGDPPRYQVRLQGADPEWGPATANRTALYLNLAAGSYRFEARAVDGDGRVSTRAAVVAFVILPPFWQRAWFQALVALALGAIAYVAYRSRVARLLALERVRSRLATDLHDDLGARLSRISILSEVAARRVASDTRSAERLLDEVGETARSLIEATADLTWSVDPHKDDLASLVTRIRRFAADLLDARDIDWTFDAPVHGADIRLSPEHRRHILLVFQEAITNVVRHARAHRVALRLGVDGTRLDASIVDDGTGFDSRHNGHGRGLGNMAARARALGGEVTVASTPGEGTRVHLTASIR